MNDRSPPERQTPAQSLRERFRETTVQAILAAAEDVLAESGLPAAHMGQIAARAGVSVGTLYNHFADRDALLAGLAYARFADMLARLDATLERTAGQKFAERLEPLVTDLLSHWERHRKFIQIVMQGEAGHYQKSSPAVTLAMRDKMRELNTRIEQVTSQGVQEKAIRPDVAELAPFFLLGLMRSLFIRDLVLENAGQDLSTQAGVVLQAFLNGVST
jgi:AcrR family transcriptional regulator